MPSRRSATRETIEARLAELGAWLRGNGTRPALPRGMFASGLPRQRR